MTERDAESLPPELILDFDFPAIEVGGRWDIGGNVYRVWEVLEMQCDGRIIWRGRFISEAAEQ